MFPTKTVMVPPDRVLTVLSELDRLLKEEGHHFDFYPIGSTADPRGESKDVDVLVDSGDFVLSNGCNNVVTAKDCFCHELPAITRPKQQGVSIHFILSVDGLGPVQVDMMLAHPVEDILFYHVHDRPDGSPYKGRHRHMLLSYLARKKGLLWSPYRGLYTRNANGKRDEFISSDPDEVAQQLLGRIYTRKSIGSADSILSAVRDPSGILNDLANDRQWNRQ